MLPRPHVCSRSGKNQAARPGLLPLRFNKSDNCCLHFVQGAVVVTVVAMWVMQMTIHEVVDVVAVRDRIMAAAGAMHVRLIVPTAIVVRRAPIGIGRRHFDHMLVHVVTMRMVQMPVVEIVHMVAVPYRRMPARRAMNVRVMRMLGVGAAAHRLSAPSRIA